MFRSLHRLAGLTTSLIDDHVIEHLRKPVFTTVAYFGLTLAVNAAQLPIGGQLIVQVLRDFSLVSMLRC